MKAFYGSDDPPKIALNRTLSNFDESETHLSTFDFLLSTIS